MVNQLIQRSFWLPFSGVKYVFKPVKEVKVLSSLTSHKAGQAEGGFPILAANDIQFSEELLFFSHPQHMHKGLLVTFSYFLQNAKQRAINIMGRGMHTYITFHYPPLFLTQIPKPAATKNTNINAYAGTLSVVLSSQNNLIQIKSYEHIITLHYCYIHVVYNNSPVPKRSKHILVNILKNLAFTRPLTQQ